MCVSFFFLLRCLFLVVYSEKCCVLSFVSLVSNWSWIVRMESLLTNCTASLYSCVGNSYWIRCCFPFRITQSHFPGGVSRVELIVPVFTLQLGLYFGHEIVRLYLIWISLGKALSVCLVFAFLKHLVSSFHVLHSLVSRWFSPDIIIFQTLGI